MVDSLIIQPPRAFAVMIRLQFDSDTRTDADLQRDILQSITMAIDILDHVKQVGVAPTAAQPTPGT